jgi:hypothetical protein
MSCARDARPSVNVINRIARSHAPQRLGLFSRFATRPGFDFSDLV